MINTGSFLKDQLVSRLLFSLIVGLIIVANLSLVLPQSYLLAGAVVASSALIGWLWTALDPYFPDPEFEDEPEQRYFYMAFYLASDETGPFYSRIAVETDAPLDTAGDLDLVEEEIMQKRPELLQVLLTNVMFLRQEPVEAKKN